MKLPKLLALAAALIVVACDIPSSTAETEEAPQPRPILPPQNFLVSGQDITFFDGRGHLRIPDGWRQIVGSEHPVEIEAERYAAAADRWAFCNMTEMTAPNLALVSQETMNRYIEALWASTTKELEDEGTSVDVSYPMVGENLRAKAIRYTVGGTDLFMNAIFSVEGAVMRGTYIACDTASPATKEDHADITALIESFRMTPP